MPDLRDHTTLRLGGPGREWVRATTEAELVAAVADADAAGTPVLLLAGGSNLVVADAGFDGLVVEVATTGVDADTDTCDVDALAQCGGVVLTVAAGEDWDELVARAVDQGWAGIEALSGIPGAVGSTPIQNVGAYGQDVSQTIARVRTWDRVDRTQRTFAAADCGFGYRHSRFKAEPGRYVVLEVTFQLRQGDLSEPVAYAELARTLGVRAGERAPLQAVRDAVLALRSGKGMVLDADDHDTWSAGSFFTNPFLTPEEAAARRQGEVERRVAHRARRFRQGLREPGRGRAGAPVHQAHPRPHQPRRRDNRRAPRARPRGARRRTRALRRHPRQRARDGRLLPLTPSPGPHDELGI